MSGLGVPRGYSCWYLRPAGACTSASPAEPPDLCFEVCCLLFILFYLCLSCISFCICLCPSFILFCIWDLGFRVSGKGLGCTSAAPAEPLLWVLGFRGLGWGFWVSG